MLYDIRNTPIRRHVLIQKDKTRTHMIQRIVNISLNEEPREPNGFNGIPEKVNSSEKRNTNA